MGQSTLETTCLVAKDFASDQEVRWCPGCGDNAILKALQKTLPAIDVPIEKFAFISGIGCSSRFPYYMNTYGFHTIHGRACAIATGTKLANPELSVWVVTGDGDAMAIGGNHFIHTLRRNININILLFNNEIYGLTKGQFSPTTPKGTITKTSPYGTVDHPFTPGELAIGAQAKFFARALDVNPKHMTETFIAAEKHDGASLVEILQNCVIFNDKIFADVTAKENKLDAQLYLEHGKPMLFGADNKKGIILNGMQLEVRIIGENGVTEADILVHDAEEIDPTLHMKLVRMSTPDFPVALGVIRNVEARTYDAANVKQLETLQATSKFSCVDDLLTSGATWEL